MHDPVIRIGSLLASLALLVTVGCDGTPAIQAEAQSSSGTRSPYVPEGYKLSFEDSFDQLNLLPDGGEGWGWASYFTGWNVRSLEGNNDQALKADANYRGLGGQSIGENGITLHEITPEGTLKLYGVPTPEHLQAQFEMPYLAGMLSGDKMYTQHKGYWEVRLRATNVSVGHHVAFWLVPVDNSWPPELDMLEIVGSNPPNPSDADHFFFNSIIEGREDEITRIIPPNGTDAWYTIGFLWDDNDMRWFLDGEEVRRRPSLQYDQEFYFIASPEMGSKWVGPTTGETQWPLEVEIDYFRVYRAP